MNERLRELAESIAKLEDERKTLAGSVRSRNLEVVPELLERKVIHPVTPVQLNGSVAAVDGGLLAQEFQGFDLVMTRSVAAIFSYEDGKLKGHAYYPSALPETTLEYTANLDTHEFQWHKALFRLKKEIGTALECVEKHKPRALLLDGSLVPQISDRPSEGSEPRQLYNEVLGIYKKLYEFCANNKVRLLGVIKDSRGRRFIEIIEKLLEPEECRILQSSNDTSFLHFLLNEGERTASFAYATTAKENIILRDLGEWGKRIGGFYLKPVRGDRPLRVEFLDSGDVDSDASLLAALSAIHPKYAYPAVLIEADLRAAMDPLELERAYKELALDPRLRSAIMKLRRDSRPFR